MQACGGARMAGQTGVQATGLYRVHGRIGSDRGDTRQGMHISNQIQIYVFGKTDSNAHRLGNGTDIPSGFGSIHVRFSGHVFGIVEG